MTEREQHRRDVLRLIHEHLNAAMIMVPLDEPRDPSEPVHSALEYLEQRGFDIALIACPETKIVSRTKLRSIAAAQRSERVGRYAGSPRRDRLIGRDVELIEVARRLGADAEPLLVVGRDGPAHVITRADFTRPAGNAAVLSLLVALDAELDLALQPYEKRVWPTLTEKRQSDIRRLVESAKHREQELPPLSYLSFGERIEAVHTLQLSEHSDINFGSQHERELMTSVRNQLAHGRTPDGCAALDALTLGLRLLQQLTATSGRTC